MHIAQILEKLANGKRCAEAEFIELFSAMLGGQLSHVQSAAVLMGLRALGESGLELSIGAREMRANALALKIPAGNRPLADNCGTGGDGSQSFNISTAAAIVAAAAGGRIAKHGNRSVSSKCGSADLLFAAGFPDQLTAAQSTQLLIETNLTFFFAPNFHPMIKNIMPVRRDLGIRTIFNLLGPLANPLAPEVQLIGVGERKFLAPMAEAAKSLGMKRVLVVHSDDGMDEISPTVGTSAVHLQDGVLQDLRIESKDLGVANSQGSLVGGDSVLNLRLLHELLDGKRDLIFEAVAVNAGALLWLMDCASSLVIGANVARESMSSGAARIFFDRWIAKAREY